MSDINEFTSARSFGALNPTTKEVVLLHVGAILRDNKTILFSSACLTALTEINCSSDGDFISIGTEHLES